MKCTCKKTYRSDFLLVGAHGRAVDAVDAVIEAARVAEVVPRAVAAPQRRRVGGAVDALLDVTVQHEACSRVNSRSVNTQYYCQGSSHLCLRIYRSI